MAEIVGTISAVIGLVQVSGEVLVAGYGFISRVRQAPTQIRNLLNEIASMNTLLGRLQDFASDYDACRSTLLALEAQGVFEQCGVAIRTVAKIIESCRSVEGEHTRNFAKKLKFPFKEDEVKRTMEQLDRLRSKLTDAVALDMAAAINRIEISDQQIKAGIDQLHTDHENDASFQWAFPKYINQDENYRAALETRQPGTGTWLLHTDLYKTFVRDRGICWIYGLPGSGKTVLSATAIESVGAATPFDEFALAYFYCDYRDSEKQSLLSLLMTSVKQIVQQHPRMMDHVKRLFEEKRQDFTRSPTSQEYADLLKTMSQDVQRVYLVVDALDEAANLEGFTDFLHTFSIDDATANVSMLITSRTNVTLENILTPIVTTNISLANAIQGDIDTYITASIEERIKTRKLKLRDPNLALLVKEKIQERSTGLFLQAKLHLEHVSGLKNDRSIKQALEKLPNALESTYERILSQITSNAESLSEARTVLMWLSRSVAPVTLPMLAEVASIRTNDEYLDVEAIATDPEDVLESLSSLITIDRRHAPPTCSLAHYSVEEYLRSANIRQSPVSAFYIDPEDADRRIADLCVQYLSFRDFAQPELFSFHRRMYKPNLPRKRFGGIPREYGKRRVLQGVKVDMPGLETRLESYALLPYASKFWSVHLNLGYSGLSHIDFEEEVVPRLQWFLHPEQSATHQYESWIEAQYFYCPLPDDCEYWQPPLNHAIRLGLTGCVAYLIPYYLQSNDINAQFPGGWTPLTAAAMSYVDVDISRLLLEAGADVNGTAEPHYHNRFTALHLAAEHADEGLVRLLLDHNASIHAQTRTGTTAFFRGARGGSLKVVEMLHQAGSDVNAGSWDKYTAIIEAVSNKDAEMVAKLLEWGADPLADTRVHFNALDLAQRGGDKETEKLILRWLDKRQSTSSDDDDDDTLGIVAMSDEEQGNQTDSVKTKQKSLSGNVPQAKCHWCHECGMVIGKVDRTCFRCGHEKCENCLVE